jgi:hypothetical protein
MSINLKGLVTLSITPDNTGSYNGRDPQERNQYSEWFNDGWLVYDDGDPGGEPNVPSWVTAEGEKPGDFKWVEGVSYNVRHWADYDLQYYYEYHAENQQWFPTKVSWSGKIVAGWNGGTSPETWSLSLTPVVVQKTQRTGNKFCRVL